MGNTELIESMKKIAKESIEVKTSNKNPLVDVSIDYKKIQSYLDGIRKGVTD